MKFKKRKGWNLAYSVSLKAKEDACKLQLNPTMGVMSVKMRNWNGEMGMVVLWTQLEGGKGKGVLVSEK